MATRNQHYVPRVYLKAWDTTVETSKEPQKKFTGVYCFKNGSSQGEGSSHEAILWEPHLYTINFDQLYLAPHCPKVYDFFVDAVYDSMNHNSPNPVYGKLGYSIIKTKSSIKKHIFEIDDWDFYYYDGNLARKKGLLSRFHDMNCYLLEDAFSTFYEKDWEKIRDTFISEIQEAPSVLGKNGERNMSLKAAEDMLEFFFTMLCRSPQFKNMSVYTWMKDILKQTFPGSKEVDQMMDAVWYTELYRIFYKKTGGYYHTILKKAMENCQFILFEAYPDAGTFVTSDHPAFQHISVVEVQNMNGFYFPLDPKYVLFIAKGSDAINNVSYRMANRDLVKKINRIIKMHSLSMVIAAEKNLNKLI